MKGLRSMCAIACVCAVVSVSTNANAQGTARSMDIPQSIRACGMGGAEVAVPWGVTSAWGNPATLGFAQGWRWEESRAQLVPGLASDVWFRTERMTAGFGGLGVAWSGQPGGAGDARLDYGVFEQTDLSGNVIGTYRSFERVRGWGFGVSAATFVDRLGKRDGARSLARYGDVAFGEYFKDCMISFVPGFEARATNRDWGVLARVSPSALLRRGAEGVWDADLALGHSRINSEDHEFTFGGEDQRALPSQISRTGVAATMSFAQPTAMRSAFSYLPVLRGLGPFVRVTFAYDSDVADSYGGGHWRVKHSGFEASILGVVDLRAGHWKDTPGEIDDATRGIGLCLPLGNVAAVRWDYAETPQADNSGLPDVRRRSWSMWVNPAEIIRRGGK